VKRENVKRENVKRENVKRENVKRENVKRENESYLSGWILRFVLRSLAIMVIVRRIIHVQSSNRWATTDGSST